jgi:drug/metabolite transporter (DMT)-like permease
MVDFLYSFNGCVFITALLYLLIWILKLVHELRFVHIGALRMFALGVLLGFFVYFLFMLSLQAPAIIASFMFVNMIIGALEGEGQ